MSRIVTANAKIKEVITLSTNNEVNNFKNRFASNILDKFDKNSVKYEEANKSVIAIKPGSCYTVVSAIHGSIPTARNFNQNGDEFPWTELLRAVEGSKEVDFMFQTWIGKPLLTNHNPKNIVGTILDAWPVKEEYSIDMLHKVDEHLNPNLVKGIKNGSVKMTSMGVLVNHSYCSICNNLAYDISQWCNHCDSKKLNLKGKKYTGQDGGLFPSKFGQYCSEINYALEGIEDSYITLGECADPAALARKVLAYKDSN